MAEARQAIAASDEQEEPAAPKKETAPKKTAAKKAAPKEKPAAKKPTTPEEKPAAKKAAALKEKPAAKKAAAPEEKPSSKKTAPEPTPAEPLPTPRRSVAFIGSECYPFVKTGGLGDVMYALPKALAKMNCDVKVILPRYKCIPWEYQEKMIYRGSFEMDLCADGTSYYVGIMEYVWDGVVYDFIDNEFFFSAGNPYIGLIDDIPRYCYFGKAALAALNYMDWIPDVIHCHDWQAALVPIYLREKFQSTPLARSKAILTIHNLRFQGKYDIQMISYWSNLPMHLFNKDVLKENFDDANMMKGGLTYSNMITTVSGTYAGEIQTPEYGEGLDAHLRYHSGKLRGIVNGIDYDLWDSSTDKLIDVPYDAAKAIKSKKKNKLALQKELGLTQDENLFVIGLISRLTNQKGLDLINAILPAMIDGNTQVVVLGTGDPGYEAAFRSYEEQYKGSVCSNIMYDEGRAHRIYAGADTLLVPSLFEPC
ncbi:MAG: glycogen synthase, partial [Lachnospiraceae bacterium]|nr:glycogen synthase [Lachnospiraceae bacterium]